MEAIWPVKSLSKSNLRRAVNDVTRCENQLKEQLNEADQALLTELVSAQHEIDSITACMDEDDGDTQQLTDGS